MSFCKSCGAVLGVGRFCTNCGAAVAPAPGEFRSPDESAVEKTNPRMPAVQPDAALGSRFPLYADEGSSSGPAADQPGPQHGGPHQAGAPAWLAAPAPGPAPAPAPAGGSHRDPDERRRGPLLWVIPVVVLLLLGVAGGTWALTRGDGSSDDTTASDPTPSAQEPGGDGRDQGSGEQTGGGESPSPDPTPPPGPPADLSDRIRASGPSPIDPGVDLRGDPVTYPVENLFDGDPTTAYRLPGDASGETITITLPSGSTVMEVGIINGYAKEDEAGDRTVDWYVHNRRVLEVEWTFDDGTTVTQTLTESREMQVLAVNSISTSTVQLRLVEVSDRPTGDLAKNVTAISEVAVRGHAD